MTAEQVRLKLNEFLGKEVIIKCSLGRNKYEKYTAKIKESKIKNEIKSFSYSDVITKTIRIDC